MWHRRTGLIYVDGIRWRRDEWEHAQRFAIGISSSDARVIDELVRYCADEHRGGRADLIGAFVAREVERYQQLVSDLYERAGAATAMLQDAQTVPLTLAEIKLVERLRSRIAYPYSARGAKLDAVDDLLNRLHFLAGHAKAVREIGGVAFLPRESAQALWTGPERAEPVVEPEEPAR